MSQALLQLLVGVAIAAASSYFTVQLSRRQFRSEKWWEKKAEAYERVIEGFHGLKKFAHQNLEAETRGQELPDDRRTELNRIFQQAKDEILRASDVGEYVLSKKAIGLLARYEAESSDTVNAESFWEYLEAEWLVAHRYMKDFILEARRDLKSTI